jgi:hypothetical protein
MVEKSPFRPGAGWQQCGGGEPFDEKREQWLIVPEPQKLQFQAIRRTGATG